MGLLQIVLSLSETLGYQRPPLTSDGHKIGDAGRILCNQSLVLQVFRSSLDSVSTSGICALVLAAA